MNPEKAIEFLEHIYSDRKLVLGLDDSFPGQKAIQLGIEALKRLQEYRADPGFAHWVMPLPGETEE